MRNKNVSIIAVTGVICVICAIAFVTCGICQYVVKASKEAIGKGTLEKVNNTICPVSGDPVNMRDPATVEYNGKIYNLCCPMCTSTFKSDPIKYSKIAEEQAKGVN